MNTAKIIIARASGVGEQVQAEMTVDTRKDIFEQLQPVYQAIDKRIWQKNLWINAHVAALQNLPPVVYMAVIEAIDYLHGQRQIPQELMDRLEKAEKVPGPSELKPAEELSDA